MFTDESKLRVPRRLRREWNRCEDQPFPELCISYQDSYNALFIVSKNCVREHFQQKHEHVKSLLKGIKNARMNCVRYDTYLAFKTSPPGLQLSVTGNEPKLSKKEWGNEALKVTEQRKAAAYAEQAKLVIELDRILHANPCKEHLEWAKTEIQKNRLSFKYHSIGNYFCNEWHPLIEIMDLYSRERWNLNMFIMEEWGKLNYQIGQEERKWIKSIKQQNEQNSEQPQPPRSTSTPDSGSEAGSSEHED